MDELINDLVGLSREFGSDPRWVVAGGGNTSAKTDEVLYVKASGHALASIDREGFARMDRKSLAAIWEADYPKGDDPTSVAERERLSLADMMASRIPGEDKRPSVETLLHDLLPWPLVVHLHPTLVNGLTCGQDGENTARRLFGDTQVWIPVTDPGYVLAVAIKNELERRRDKGFVDPDFIFLANHGVFAGGTDAVDVRRKYEQLDRVLKNELTRNVGAMPQEIPIPGDHQAWDRVVREIFGAEGRSTAIAGGELNRYLKDPRAATPLTGCLTPDHIVYAGPGAVYLEEKDPQNLPEAWKKACAEYSRYWGKPPNLALWSGGALVTASGEKTLENAALLIKNALEVCAYAESFGGPLVLEERFVRFIVDWEVENYRSQVAAK